MIQQQAEAIQSLQGNNNNSPLYSDDSPLKGSSEFTRTNSTRDFQQQQPEPAHPSSVESLMKKLEFLVAPGQGYILQFLSTGDHYEDFSVKKHMLQLLCKIFELRGNPFVRKKLYVDAYVSYFYIRFIKLYQNYVMDPPTLELCQLYLRLLLAFSVSKSGNSI